jgi:hypothetical protein
VAPEKYSNSSPFTMPLNLNGSMKQIRRQKQKDNLHCNGREGIKDCRSLLVVPGEKRRPERIKTGKIRWLFQNEKYIR